MSAEENKAVIRRLIEEAFNKGNMAVVDECTAADFVHHGAALELKGPELIKQLVTILRTAFPDLHFTIDDIVAEGDMVAHRFTYRGTFKGEMSGIAPTGKQFTQTAAAFTRFVGGKQAEAWQYGDSLSFYQQLGVTPPTG